MAFVAVGDVCQICHFRREDFLKQPPIGAWPQKAFPAVELERFIRGALRERSS